jgi:hypothetical protein
MEEGETIGGVDVVPLAVMARQQWTYAVHRKLFAIEGERVGVLPARAAERHPREHAGAAQQGFYCRARDDPTMLVDRTRSNEQQEAANGDVAYSDAMLDDVDTHADAVMMLQTEGVGGEVTVHTVRYTVANAFFPVLMNAFNDTAGDGTLIPLDADACPTDAMQRLMAICDAVMKADDPSRAVASGR